MYVDSEWFLTKNEIMYHKSSQKPYPEFPTKPQRTPGLKINNSFFNCTLSAFVRNTLEISSGKNFFSNLVKKNY